MSIIANIVATAQVNLEIDERLRQREILRWLSPDDVEKTHERHYRKLFQSTGQWLLDDPIFINWRDDAQPGLLWCHGPRKLPS